MVGPSPSVVHIIGNWEALCGACFSCNLDGTMFVIIGYVSMWFVWMKGGWVRMKCSVEVVSVIVIISVAVCVHRGCYGVWGILTGNVTRRVVCVVVICWGILFQSLACNAMRCYSNTNLISITLQFIMKFIYASAAILASSIATVSGQSTVGNWDITYNNTEATKSPSLSPVTSSPTTSDLTVTPGELTTAVCYFWFLYLLLFSSISNVISYDIL